MELERNQPTGNGLREALAPWFDHAAARLVLLCAGLATFGALIGVAPAAFNIAAALAAMAVARRTAGLRDLDATRRRAWRWLYFALAASLLATLADLVMQGFGPPAPSGAAILLQYAFFPCAAMAVAAFLLSTRARAFAPQFWFESLLVALCVGAVLWLVVPRDLAPTATLDGVVVVLAAILLLRRSDWQGWPGLVIFALAMIALAGARLLEARAAAGVAAADGAGTLQLFALAALAVAAHFDYLRTERRAPPMDAAHRGSPLAPLIPYAVLMLAAVTLLALHPGGTSEPAGLIAMVVCIAAGLLFTRQAVSTGFAVARRTGLAADPTEARFNALIRSISDAIAIVDSDGRVSYLTPTAERIFGQRAHSLIGRPLPELVALEDRARLREFLNRDLAQDGASAKLEARILHDDDKQRVVEIHGTNLESEAAINGLLLTLRDATDRKGTEEQLKRMAFHDPLTLLANRSLFRDRVEHAVAVSKRNGRGVAVMFVDLDNFKKINDSLGHAIGDRVLQKSAQRLVNATRNGDTVARLGGDEFAVVLENLNGRNEVIDVAARIVDVLQQSLDLPGSDLRVAASIGIAFAGEHDGVEELMRNADVAMYSSKSQGKGRYTIHEPDMNRAAHKRQELEGEIAQGVLQGQFLLHYQPIVELRSGYLLGVEALLRWRHPVRGIIRPAEFVGVAEKSGQIIALGRWVLAQACSEVHVWQARLPEGRQVRLGVNISAVQLAQADLCTDVAKALESSGIDPGCLVIELTESALMQNTDEVLGKLNRLKKLGVRIAIDDFGTGYSSLSYLHRFPIDILKIDRSFVEQLGRIESGDGLARSIITLGGTLGLEVVAEGIELESQQRELVELGCVAGQGFYYSKPALLHELEYSIHMKRRRTMADTLPEGARFTATGRFVVGDLRPADLGFVSTGTFGRELANKIK